MKIPAWLIRNLPTIARIVVRIVESRPAKGNFNKTGVLLLALSMTTCATLRHQVEDFCKRNPTECNEPIPSPPPSPSPLPTIAPPASPQPDPTPEPVTCAHIPAGSCSAPGWHCVDDPRGPRCEQIPSPSPTPAPPSPAPSPCATPSPSNTCARPHDPSISEDPAICWKCSDLRGWQVAQGNWIDHKRPDGWLEDNVGSGRYVTKDCDVVRNDGTLIHLREDGYLGNVCPRLDGPCPETSPKPCASPPPGATPNPGPTPGTCPQLVRWGSGIHAQMTPDFQPVPKEPVFSGNTIEFDSTARFGSGRGTACNSDHHAACDAQGDDHGPNWRHCEDPRGPVWTVLDDCGAAKVKITNGGWGIQFVRVQSGTCRVRSCPRPDVVDEEGQPVRTSADACNEASVSVQ